MFADASVSITCGLCGCEKTTTESSTNTDFYRLKAPIASVIRSSSSNYLFFRRYSLSGREIYEMSLTIILLTSHALKNDLICVLSDGKKAYLNSSTFSEATAMRAGTSIWPRCSILF